MGWEELLKSSSAGSNNYSSINPKEVFYLFTNTLLSLIIPLSFILLARLSTVQYYLFLQHQRPLITYYSHPQYNSPPPPPPLIPYLFLHQINPCILYLLVFLITIASLIHAFTGKCLQPRLYIAWILLCIFQLCVGLGIEGSIMGGFNYDQYSEPEEKNSFGVVDMSEELSIVVFVLGLHETTRVWGRMVVRTVVDDTVFGNNNNNNNVVRVRRKERWVERVAVCGSLGILWWWKLRDDVETLVFIAAEAKKEETMMMMMRMDIIDDGWRWLYYLTVTIGMVRIVMWIIGMTICSFIRIRRRATVEPSHEINDDKV